MSTARIRQDLSLQQAEPDSAGRAVWLLYDPFSARYFRISHLQMQLLGYLNGAAPDEIAKCASQELGQEVSTQQVETLLEFLQKNNLVVGDENQQVFYEKQRAQTPGWLKMAAKSYLFVRVPLVKPDRFLEKTLPYVRWLWMKPTLMLITLLGLVGLLMTVRQWDHFLATFMYFFSLEGAIAFALSLTLVKALHELGHAYMAKAQGCRVPVIGVAFLVLWPVLYTDNTDAWKLRARRQRLKINLAGVGVEMMVASLCLFAWHFAPEGIFRSVFFVLATTTWIASLLINFNPLMKFDGYYIMSDWLREPNMEPRAHALGKWWLRKTLFGFQDAPPETPKARLIVYSLAIWVYRFLLFLGIALLVYHLFFKVLGIVLFVVEIVYFILAPIWREVKEWTKRKEQFRLNRQILRTFVVGAVLVAALFVPWKDRVSAPAVVKHPSVKVYAPAAGQLSAPLVKDAQRVEIGDPLLKISAPDLDYEMQDVRLRYEELLWQRASLGFDDKTLRETLIVARELATQHQRFNSLLAKSDRLDVKAESAGQITDMVGDLQPGQWVEEGEYLFSIKDPRTLDIWAYLSENDIMKVNTGAAATFYPQGGGREVIALRVAEVEYFGLKELDEPYSASLFGGGVGVRQNDKDKMIPAQSTYRVRLTLNDPTLVLERVLRGRVVIDTQAHNLASSFINEALASVIKELGF